MPRELVLERCDPSRGMRRYYLLSIEPTLFGGAGLRRAWGRIGSRGGSSRLELHADGAAAAEALATWLRRKSLRGYVHRAGVFTEEFDGSSEMPRQPGSI